VPAPNKTRETAVLETVRAKYSLRLAHALLRPRKGDRFLASFPRSGSTWLRAILTNILDPTARGDPRVFNRLIPGVSLGRLAQVMALPAPRLIHTHTPFRRDLGRAVYLCRDGRDVLVSYYHYQVTRQGLADRLPFPAWFERYASGRLGQRWHENVESWLVVGARALGDNLLVVKFEALKADPRVQVGRIADFLGLGAGPERIERAIADASLESSRAWERRLDGAVADPNASFYRGGGRGQWQAVFTPPIERQFMNLSRRALELGGYL
jgi:hypothetical protein